LRVVVRRANHNRACPGRGVGQRSAPQLADIVALLQIAHLTGVTIGEPLREEAVLRSFADTSDAREIESDLGGESLDFAADDGQRQSAGHAGAIIGEALLATSN